MPLDVTGLIVSPLGCVAQSTHQEHEESLCGPHRTPPARDRRGFYLQRSALDRCGRYAYGRQVDREIRRLWECSDDRGHDLSSGSRGRTFLTGDSWQIVAGSNLTK